MPKSHNIPSVMKHEFSEVPKADIPRSSFDLSHGYKTTFDAGPLIPVYCEEALPGDTFNLRMTALARLATPLHPFMDNLFLSTFFFAVPYRLVWDNWQKFNGEQDNPGDSTDFTIPQMVSTASTGYLEGSLHDYMGLPTQIPDLTHSSLFHRAYNLIYNTWFRDENLQSSLVVDTDNGPDDPTDYVLKNRGKRHDYFTSALPWPQKGDAVDIPLSGNAPVTGIGKGSQTFGSTSGAVYETGASSTRSYADYAFADGSSLGANNSVILEEDPNNAGYPAIYADMSAVSGATINELRQSFQIQKLLERDARGGTRYIEMVKAHFGVTSPDARLQRPEYLGGGQSAVSVSPIAQTGETNSTPQGNLAAYGTATLNQHGFTKSFTEHCLIIGLISARADLSYQQGLDRKWSRLTRYDFYYPVLSHIGEQTILNKEIYAQGSGDAAADAAVFGYQERYAEYRYQNSQITGAFRSNAATSLDTWHLAQEFGSLPTLGNTFITENPPVDRVIAVTSEPHFLFDSIFKIKAARPMPTYSVPGMIDHF